MGINIRAKGQNGERELADILNKVVNEVLLEMGVERGEKNYIQRNQNQSAVGGSDLSGAFDLTIEIKRCETLAVNTWWQQCTKAAERNAELPVLIFRQSRQPWRVVMQSHLVIGTHKSLLVRSEVKFEDFLTWFREHVEFKIKSGYKLTV